MLSNSLKKQLDEFLKLMPGTDLISLADIAQKMEITTEEAESLFQILNDKDYVNIAAKPDYMSLTKNGRNFRLESKFYKEEKTTREEQLFNIYLGYFNERFDKIINNTTEKELNKIIDAFHSGLENTFIDGEKYNLLNLEKLKIYKSDRPNDYFDHLNKLAQKGQVNFNNDGEAIFFNHDLLYFGEDVTSKYLIYDFGKLPKTRRNNGEYLLDIFVSHSHKDKDVAKKIADLLSKSFNLINERIRCTSAPGYKLRGGAKTMETLRDEVESSKLLVVIITKNSIESDYVLFELGARWGLELPYIPLFYFEDDAKLLPGPLSNIIGLSMSDTSDMHQFISDVSKYINISPQSANTYNQQIIELSSFCSGK